MKIFFRQKDATHQLRTLTKVFAVYNIIMSTKSSLSNWINWIQKCRYSYIFSLTIFSNQLTNWKQQTNSPNLVIKLEFVAFVNFLFELKNEEKKIELIYDQYHLIMLINWVKTNRCSFYKIQKEKNDLRREKKQSTFAKT